MTRLAFLLAAALALLPGSKAWATSQAGTPSVVNVQAKPGDTAGLAPFMGSGDPLLFPAGTTAQQYDVQQPANTTSYRLVNPCGVDIRIKSVTSMSTGVTLTTGTRFLARTAETMASTKNPLGASSVDRIISVMTVGDPGAAGCTVELSYGNGG